MKEIQNQYKLDQSKSGKFKKELFQSIKELFSH